MMSRVQRFAVPLTLEIATLPNVWLQTHTQTDRQTDRQTRTALRDTMVLFAEDRKCAFGAKTPALFANIHLWSVILGK